MTTGSGPQQPQGNYPPQPPYPQPPYPPQYQGGPYQPPGHLGYQGYPMPGVDQSGKATTSLVLGIIGMLAWCIPIIGLPVTIVGLVFGIKSMNSSKRGMAIAGVVLNIIGLFASVVNAAIGAYLGATGQHPLLK
jgi:hypothetical protein